MRATALGILGIALTACSISMNVAPAPRHPAHPLYPVCPASTLASSELPSSLSDEPIAIRGRLVSIVSTSTAMRCLHCRGDVEGLGASGPFACEEELGICCNTLESVFLLRVGKTMVEVPLGYSRLDCDMEGVYPQLWAPVVVTGILHATPDSTGKMTYSMTKISDVCSLAR